MRKKHFLVMISWEEIFFNIFIKIFITWFHFLYCILNYNLFIKTFVWFWEAFQISCTLEKHLHNVNCQKYSKKTYICRVEFVIISS